MYNFIKDIYYETRGSYVRILRLCCRSCGHILCLYQKDGPGNLRRMYLDRIIKSRLSKLTETDCTDHTEIICLNCSKMLGTCYLYEKEKRQAIILYQDALTKKVISRSTIEKEVSERDLQ